MDALFNGQRGTNVSPTRLRKGGGERREAKEGGMREGKKGERKEKKRGVGKREREQVDQLFKAHVCDGLFTTCEYEMRKNWLSLLGITYCEHIRQYVLKKGIKTPKFLSFISSFLRKEYW